MIITDREAWVDVVEDSYEEGEGIDVVNTYDVPLKGEYETLYELLDDISMYGFSDNTKDWMYDEEIGIFSDMLCNEEGDPLSSSEEKLWKKGEIMAYNHHIQFPLEVVSEQHTMTNEEAKGLGLATY